jgi:hypothetical protein
MKGYNINWLSRYKIQNATSTSTGKKVNYAHIPLTEGFFMPCVLHFVFPILSFFSFFSFASSSFHFVRFFSSEYLYFLVNSIRTQVIMFRV